MSLLKRIISYIVIGFVFSVVVCTIMITLGYFDAYAAMPDKYVINILNLPIYELTRDGEKFNGVSVGINLGIVSMICIAVITVFGEVRTRLVA